MVIHNKQEIIKALDEAVTAFVNYVSQQDKTRFEAMPGGKWSSGQNLDHLIRSMKPLQPAYSLPKFILRLFFGKANRPSRSYDQLVEKYKTKLSAGGKASGRFIPPTVAFESKEGLVKTYEKQKDSLLKKIARQNENDLDTYIFTTSVAGKTDIKGNAFFYNTS